MSSQVYHEFLKQLFEREMWKRLAQDEVSVSKNLLTEFQSLSERLSQALFTLESTIASVNSLSISKADEYILNSIPINITKDHITFIHKSIQEFLVSQSWIYALNQHKSSLLFSLINSRLVSQESGILNFLSQQIHLPTHSKLLLNQVLSSQSNKEVSIASSNALTILNACRFSFSTLDLSSIHAPGVNLSNTMILCKVILIL
jgi:hypothetical protein